MRRDVLTGDWISVAAARQNRAFLPAGRARPARAADADEPVRDPVALRRRGVREQVAVVRPGSRRRRTATPRRRSTRRAGSTTSTPPVSAAPARRVGRCEVVCFSPEHEGSFGTLTPHPRPHRDRGVGRPHRRAVGAARHRAGVPVREPRRGDRRHARPPARADLRLPLRHAAHAAPARRDRPRGPDLFARILEFEQDSERVHPARRALDRVRAVRRPLAARGAPAAAPARRRHRRDDGCRARRARAALPAPPARGRRALRLPHPVHRGLAPGAGERRPRRGPAAPASSPRPRRAADKLKFLAGSEAAMGAWIGDVPPETAAARLREAIETESPL